MYSKCRQTGPDVAFLCVTFIENFNYMMKMGIFPSLKVVEQVSPASFPPCCDKDGAHWLVQFPNYLKS